MRPTRTLWIPGLVACGFFGGAGLGAVSQAESTSDVLVAEVSAPEPLVAERASPDMSPLEASLRSDVRVRAFLRAYDAHIDSVSFRDDDLVFTVAGQEIHFLDGRMLAAHRLDRRDRCDSIFYRYPLEMPDEPIPVSTDPVRFCTDLQEALWGRTEAQIRRGSRSTTFIDRRMFVNDVVADALVGVEADLLSLAARDPEVADWIDEIDITYSFIDRGIAGTRTRSQHSWGLAVDFVPDSYEGRQVYWRWTRAWNRTGWHRTPLDQRWSPPDNVIETFERHGFLWGGKWAHFDNLHFEYRPEILEYNRILAADAARVAPFRSELADF